MFRPTAQPYVLVELEPAVVATTVVNQDIWRVPAQAQPAQAVSLVLVVVLVLLVEASEVDLLLVEDLLVDPALLLATSAAVQIILLGTAKPRP